MVKRLLKALLPERVQSADKRQDQLSHVLRRLDNIEYKLDTIERDIARASIHDLHIPTKDQTDPKQAYRTQERKVYSQFGEDGILMYIFSKIGTTNKTFVEIGIGITECNTRNLAQNFGWNGLLLDKGRSSVARARHCYEHAFGIDASRVRFVHCFITAENINTILTDNHVQGEIDLLSIDVDGNDYWIWRCTDVIRPRVVIIEYNASFGIDRSISVKYDPDFDVAAKHPSGSYHGASLRAMTKLAHHKGYILAACESCGVNVVYVRKDVAEGKIDELSVESAYYPHILRSMEATIEQQFDEIAGCEFQEI